MPSAHLRESKALSATSLSPQAILRRTFGGMALFVACPLLAIGAWLIRDQFIDPVGSHSAGLLFAAVLIAGGLVLLAYVVHPGVASKSTSRQREETQLACRTIEISLHPKEEARSDDAELALQHRYDVDNARIRL